MRRTLLFSLLVGVFLFPGISFAATPKPAFFDSIKSGADIAKLTDAQRVEYRAYLSAAAIETPGAVITIDSLTSSIDKATSVNGDSISVSLSLMSPIAKGYADSHQGTADIPNFSLKLGLTDSKGADCSAPLETKFPISDLNPTFLIPTTADCDHISVTAALADWNGIDIGSWNIKNPKVSVVEEKSVSLIETATPAPIVYTDQSVAQTDFRTLAIIIILFILFIIGVSAIALQSFRKGKR